MADFLDKATILRIDCTDGWVIMKCGYFGGGASNYAAYQHEHYKGELNFRGGKTKVLLARFKKAIPEMANVTQIGACLC